MPRTKKVVMVLISLVVMVFLLYCVGCSNWYRAPIDHTGQGISPDIPPGWLKEIPPPYPWYYSERATALSVIFYIILV